MLMRPLFVFSVKPLVFGLSSSSIHCPCQRSELSLQPPRPVSLSTYFYFLTLHNAYILEGLDAGRRSALGRIHGLTRSFDRRSGLDV